jgi:hypothetical protein
MTAYTWFWLCVLWLIVSAWVSVLVGKMIAFGAAHDAAHDAHGMPCSCEPGASCKQEHGRVCRDSPCARWPL